MKANISVHSYSLPLVCPLDLAGEWMESREGWLVELVTESGQRGWGEVAPLPGASSRGELSAVPEWNPELFDSERVTPSVSCGLDMAFFNLRDGDSMPDPLKMLEVKPRDIPINALLIGEPDNMVLQARVAQREGYRTMKIKVGRRSPATEVQILHKINQAVSDDVVFRLDANRSWVEEDADRYLDVLSEMNIEYVEEPFADPHYSLSWSERTGVPVALDESIRSLEPAALHAYAGIRAVVLKPTLMGGLVRCATYAEAARDIGAYPVVSALMESGVGTLSLARFATAVCDPETAVGLDTYRWLSDDVLSPRLQFKDGCLSADQLDWQQYSVSVG